MKIAVIGLGYVGLSTMISFLKHGNTVIGVDSSIAKINSLNNKVSPIAEPGIEELFNYDYLFTTDYNSIKDVNIIFVCVDTPTDENYISDLTNLHNCIESIKDVVSPNKLIVIKSTVPVGTTRDLYNKMKILHPQLNLKFAFLT